MGCLFEPRRLILTRVEQLILLLVFLSHIKILIIIVLEQVAHIFSGIESNKSVIKFMLAWGQIGCGGAGATPSQYGTRYFGVFQNTFV
jgi:hypothetical protein